jgi:hypothetical protein
MKSMKTQIPNLMVRGQPDFGATPPKWMHRLLPFILPSSLHPQIILKSNPILHQTKKKYATCYHLQLPGNDAKMLVRKYVHYISHTHLNVNPGFIIQRVITPYVPKTSNLSKSIVYRK